MPGLPRTVVIRIFLLQSSAAHQQAEALGMIM